MLLKWIAMTALLAALSTPNFARAADDNNANKKPADAQRVELLFKSYRDGKVPGDDFPHLDAGDIPALLELTGGTRMLRAFPVNDISSQRQAECSEGMVALWLIEGIRKGDKFPSLNPLCLTAGPGSKDWGKESEANHQDVARAYAAWWKKVKDLPWEKANAIDPLEGTGLHWY